MPPEPLEPYLAEAHAGPEADARPKQTRTLRVLLVEDNPDDALLLERHLRRAGFAPFVLRIETAEAMEAALRDAVCDWEIILADYNLPRFSAPLALQLLKNTPHDIPFIMMSGAVSEETAVAAMRAGAHDYVSKENLARLAPAIDRELNEATSRRTKRAAERALRLSEERFHRLVEATPLPLLIADMSGRIVYANAAVERLLGFTPAAMQDGPVTLEQILPAPGANGSHGDSAIGSLVEVSRTRAGETVERVCLHRSGVSLPVLLGAAILNPEADREAQQVAAFLVDLSEQKRSEEVLRRTEKLAATGRLAGSSAQEMDNPLEAITNCLYLLERGDLPEAERGFLSLAQQELDRVTHITTQTLRFYRQSSRPVQVQLADLVQSVLSLYEGRLRDHGVSVMRDFAPLPAILAYDGEIRQVLANLVGNALDAMASADESARGTLTLRLRSTRDWQTGEPAVAILIADTGSGMSAATLRRIYEPFFSTKGITGTGLGLWVSLGILVKHQGRVRVRSRQAPPSGTIFRITLPVAGAPEAFHPEEHTMPALEV